jgi:hypothetical protein
MKAFRSWSAVDCGGGKQASMTFVAKEDVACKKAEYNRDGKNVNVVLFQDNDWKYRGIDGTLAKTSTTFDTETGEIFDADIEVNTAFNKVTVTDTAGQIQYDLQRSWRTRWGTSSASATPRTSVRPCTPVTYRDHRDPSAQSRRQRRRVRGLPTEQRRRLQPRAARRLQRHVRRHPRGRPRDELRGRRGPCARELGPSMGARPCRLDGRDLPWTPGTWASPYFGAPFMKPNVLFALGFAAS